MVLSSVPSFTLFDDNSTVLILFGCLACAEAGDLKIDVVATDDVPVEDEANKVGFDLEMGDDDSGYVDTSDAAVVFTVFVFISSAGLGFSETCKTPQGSFLMCHRKQICSTIQCFNIIHLQ